MDRSKKEDAQPVFFTVSYQKHGKHLTIRRIASSLYRFIVSVAHFSALVLHQKM
jgi:hypothetical protein